MKYFAPVILFVLITLPIRVVYAQSIGDGLYATFYLGEEQLFFELLVDKSPMTVANFVGLAEGSITNAAFKKGRPFFDGSSFNRVVPGHVIQGGNPNTSAAEDAGYIIPNEINPDLSHALPGMLGMANSGPHTANNVFYITLADRSYLDGDYTLFGTLLYGNLQAVRLNTRIDSLRIVRIGRNAEAYKVDDEIMARLVKQVKDDVEHKEKAKMKFENNYLNKNYPGAITSRSGWQYIEVEKGHGRKVRKNDIVYVQFTGKTPQGVEFESTNTCGTYWREQGTVDGYTCEYFPGKTSINKGLDEAILQMKRGATWIVILPPSSAYGTAGYYPPARPGEKRFHFSPNTTLIYRVKVDD